MRLHQVGTMAALEKAARRDPGSYRVRMRAADQYAARGQCAEAHRHALAARALYPSATAPKRVLNICR